MSVDKTSLSKIAIYSDDEASFRIGRRRLYPPLKRLIDIVGALALGLMALPVVIVAALLVRRDGGPAFYHQQRLGRDGAVFEIWKLRSMVMDADACLARHLEGDAEARLEWDKHQKLRCDPRITRVGRVLRKYSIDELPQFWNVLRGDMSLVGPRPMFPEQRGLYPGTAYFDMRPGLTGLWQISERNRCSFAERAAYDTTYAGTMSLHTDLAILLKTVTVVVRGTGV